jgi:hypothetical protein
MPLDNFITRPDFSRQIKQYSGTTANLSGSTKIAQDLFVKNIEIDTAEAVLGDVLVYDGTKFLPATPSEYGNSILNGMLLSYNTGLTFNITSGQYRMNGVIYLYTGGTINIISGNNLYNRFDVVYVTGDSFSRTHVLSGTPAPSPTIPSLSSTQLQVGIISVPVNFTGGTGSTIIQITSDTVFEYYLGTNTGIQRSGPNNAEAIGDFSFALSRDSKTYGVDSVALGRGVKVSGQSQTVVGQYNDSNTDDYFQVGNGTSDGSRSNAFRVTTGGSTYVSNKLFISNVEIETTGASTNQALIFDGTKFKPQNVTGGTGSSGLTSGTSLGNGVKVLFSSDTTNLSFATLSSQTPSTLRIISSATGVILFSATTGSEGPTGNFVPLTGTTYLSPMQGDLVFTGDTNTQVYNGIKTYYDDGGGNTGYTFVNAAAITLGITNNTPDTFELNITPSFANATSTNLSIFDTATGSGLIVSVPDTSGQANKLIKVKSDETGFDFHEDGGIFYGTATNGGTLYYTATTDATVTSYENGDSYLINFGDNNIGDSFININSVGDARIYKNATTPLENDDIIGGKIYLIAYDGTYFQLVTLGGSVTGSTVSGNFLPLSGGTLTGGLSATTISATSIDRINYIDFNTGASVTQNFGRTFFNGTEQTLSYYGEGITEIKVGQQLYSRVYNNTGSILTKGTAVKVTGATQDLPTVCPAIATHTGENTVIGLVANNIANGSSGLVINNGLISGLTLNNFVVGDTLYLSPVSAGTYVNSLTGFGFNIRTNVIGRVVATGTTTGQIYVKTDNEDSTLSLTNLERNIVEGNAISTGIYEFTGLTTGSTNTTFNISPVRGWIVYNTYQYATAPQVTNVYYSGGTNLTTPYLTSNTQTYILLTSASTISYQTTFPTPQQRRENIYLGKLGHGTRTSIINVFSEPDSDISPLSQLRDILTPIKLINDGVIPSANGANLNINTSAGVLYGMGLGFATNQLNPNSLTINATTPTTFQYRTQTGGTGGAFSSTTTIDVDYYDLNGTRTNIGGAGKTSTNQRIFMLQNGQFRIQYGQQQYGDLATAIAAVDTESFTTFQNFRDNAILIGILSVRSDATALNDIAQAKFTFASKFGEVVGGTGGIATTTLQQAYDNSVQPEITINSTLDGLSIKNGTGNANNVTNLLEGIDSTDVTTSFIRADGAISGLTFLGDASNLTGVLSKTLLTRNIPVTSQVAQVGSFYLYDKLTITSATASVTVTSITSDASISAYTPSIKFFANTGVTVTFQNSATLKTEGGLDAVISGSTYDSITFTYNNDIGRYFQTNINNYI